MIISLSVSAPVSLLVNLALSPFGVFAYLMDPLLRDKLLLAASASPCR